MSLNTKGKRCAASPEGFWVIWICVRSPYRRRGCRRRSSWNRGYPGRCGGHRRNNQHEALLSPICRYINCFIPYGNKRMGMVINLEQTPLLTFIVIMMITIFYVGFNPDAIIQNYHNIMQRTNVRGYYSSTYYFISKLFNKIPLVIICICFSIPIQIIYRRHKNIIFVNNTSKT